MKNFIKEFKEFISKGNVLDMAIGVIIGSSFGKIVSSLVSDVIMPLIGVILGGLDFTNIVLKIKDAKINIGIFIQNVTDFLIIALCVFLFVKFINVFKHKEEKKLENVKKEEVVLLEEIRDLLKKNNKKRKAKTD